MSPAALSIRDAPVKHPEREGARQHHHPAEQWSQADYHQFAAVFARVGRKGGFADAEVPTNETIFLADDGEVVHPRTRQVMHPRAPGGPDFKLGRYEDPRRALAQWMTAADNPYFARTMANRLWGHFLGRGIIHPIDDARSTNPPSNPELMDALAAKLVEYKYDLRKIVRDICNSAAYQRTTRPNESNELDDRNFAKATIRRMRAEVMLDCITQVTETKDKFRGLPLGARAVPQNSKA